MSPSGSERAIIDAGATLYSFMLCALVTLLLNNWNCILRPLSDSDFAELKMNLVNFNYLQSLQWHCIQFKLVLAFRIQIKLLVVKLIAAYKCEFYCFVVSRLLLLCNNALWHR